FAPNGTTLTDLLLVAADGSSSRPLTARVPRPWGTDYTAPSWRPRGATGARLGSRPEAPLPLESGSASSFRPGAEHSELGPPGRGRARRHRRGAGRPRRPARLHRLASLRRVRRG